MSDMYRMKTGDTASYTDDQIQGIGRPLRPNVPPVNQPPIGLLPLLIAVLLSLPWWVGVWTIVRSIWR